MSELSEYDLEQMWGYTLYFMNLSKSLGSTLDEEELIKKCCHLGYLMWAFKQKS